VRRAAIAAAVVVSVGAAAGAAAAPPDRVRQGEQLYGRYCITCHGPAGAGVTSVGPSRGAEDRPRLGPPLRGAGARSADFYLRTGYMPLRSPYDVPKRQRSILSNDQIEALVAYVASLGGGPPVPEPHPERGSLADGLKLFTEHCAGCHQVVAEGGVVTGTRVPPLEEASAVEIAEAVRIGPYLMPRFSKRAIGDRQLDSIIRYVQYAKSPQDEGGWAIGHLGPIPEGMVTWLLAGVLLVGVAVVIGKRASS
jgi:ubiquinol-cytochrome c reductase cytochrome c subunit